MFSIVQVVLHEKSPFNLLPESVISTLSANSLQQAPVNYQYPNMSMHLPVDIPVQEESNNNNINSKIETYMNQVQRLTARNRPPVYTPPS
jgi:hypothetical protein